MIVHEAIKTYKDTLRALARNGVSATWVRYLELYEDYTRLCAEGHKQMYIIAYLSDVYRLKKTQIYKIIGKMVDTWRE